MVDEILDRGAIGTAQADSGSEPLGEGAHVWAEKGVNGVGDAVVRAEPAVGHAE